LYDNDVHPIRAVRAKHDGLFDIAGARRPGDEIDCAGQFATFVADQLKCFFMT
jgi:hypothetical protein